MHAMSFLSAICNLFREQFSLCEYFNTYLIKQLSWQNLYFAIQETTFWDVRQMSALDDKDRHNANIV